MVNTPTIITNNGTKQQFNSGNNFIMASSGIRLVKNKKLTMPTIAVMATFDKNKIKPLMLSTTATRNTLFVINLKAFEAALQKFRL